MSGADLICEVTGCSDHIYDKCEECKSSYCEACIKTHSCNVSTSQIIGNKPDSGSDNQTEVEDWSERDKTSVTSSSSSQMSSISESPNGPINPPAPKKKIKAGTEMINRIDVRNRYAAYDKTIRPAYLNMSLVVSKSTSWVWAHFMKFYPILHSDMKDMASCNKCRSEAGANKDIKFHVEYKVST